MVIVVIPIVEIIGEALIAAGEAIAANAVPAAIGTGTAGVIIVASQHASSNSTPATDTTTIVGSGKMDCGDSGKYGEYLKKSGDNKYDRDHIPSKAALQQAARKILADNPLLARKLSPDQLASLFGEKGLISKMGEIIVIPKSDHQSFSPTNGNGPDRNTPEQIEKDSKELQEAAKKDTKAMEEAEGKKMDAECLEKYKKAAEKIRQKTHAEYIKDLTDLIKSVINKR